MSWTDGRRHQGDHSLQHRDWRRSTSTPRYWAPSGPPSRDPPRSFRARRGREVLWDVTTGGNFKPPTFSDLGVGWCGQEDVGASVSESPRWRPLVPRCLNLTQGGHAISKFQDDIGALLSGSLPQHSCYDNTFLGTFSRQNFFNFQDFWHESDIYACTQATAREPLHLILAVAWFRFAINTRQDKLGFFFFPSHTEKKKKKRNKVWHQYG